MDTVQPGQMLGPYRIINQIGKGGMATVYKAYQPSVDRYVAVKVLPSQLAESKEFAARFQQEARIIAKLEHPHILPVFDYGESNGVAYFVMRYLEAGTLKDRMVAGRPLPVQEIDRLFTQLADALSYAHGHGVVHRDLKPANALIDSQGNVFLTDFGIAKLLESASPRLTQTDAIMGTPAYISPEQAQGQPVDQRSDIYSLGIILYEMVTGSVPFVAETPLAVIFKHISDPLPPPSLVKPDIPRPIEKVILKALAKDPRDRFATAAEFVAAWKHALETREKVAERVTVSPARPTTGTKAASRSGMPTVWIVGCLVAVCSLFGLGGVALMVSSLGESSTPSAAPPTQTVVSIPPTNTSAALPTSTSPVTNNNGDILLQDDFSDNSLWGTLTDSTSSVEYQNDTLHMQVFRENYVIWSTPNDEDYKNVHLEATVINNDTDPTTAFGFICAQQPKEWSFYYLAATPGGEYAIIRATDGESDVFLTGDGKWAYSDLIAYNASSYRVSADCSGGRLTLYVDGKQIASVTDNTYGTGRVGLFTWSGARATSADVTFDDFLLMSR
ncbi:MAG TPA: protein kinase [Anaerolineales bacterium]|nr:protein kinase [Anaerolineales bacterium]